MGMSRGSGNPQQDLNGMAPAANVVRLGDQLNDIILALNYVIAQQAAMITALVAAVGTTVPSLATVTALTAPTTVPNRLLVHQAPEITGDLP